MKTTKSKSITKLGNSCQVESRWLGTGGYQEILEKQIQSWNEIKSKSGDSTSCAHIYGCEHPLSITLGKRAGLNEVFEQTDAPIFKIDRGGQATLHSPGQLVVYPVFPVRQMGLGAREFVRLLLTVTQKALRELGIEAELRDDAGLYTASGKVCFVGLRIEAGVSRHGLSINVRNDLNEFRKIRPCGVLNQQMDSLKNHGVEISSEILFKRWMEIFWEQLNETSAATPALQEPSILSCKS